MTNLGDFRNLSFFFIPALPCRSSFPSSEIPNWKSLIYLYQTDAGSIPGLGRSPGEGNGNLLQYSCLENPMDTGAWWATVHRVTKSQTWVKWLSMHTCIYIYLYTHTYIHIYTYVYTYIHTYIHTYTYIYIYTHTCIYIYTAKWNIYFT